MHPIDEHRVIQYQLVSDIGCKMGLFSKCGGVYYTYQPAD